MSKTAPGNAPKPNIFITMLYAMAVFMLLNMWLGQKGQQNVSYPKGERSEKVLKTSGDFLNALQDLDGRIPKDADQAHANVFLANTLEQGYGKAIDEDLKAKKLSEDDAKALKTEAKILGAHVQLNMGLFANDSNVLRVAYNALEPDERMHSGTPAWNKPIEVIEKGERTTTSGHGLYEKLISTLSARNKTDLIWGAIPGGYQLVDALVGLTGHNPNFSYAFAAFLLALIVRAIVFPLAQKQLMVSRKMSQLVPRLNEIKEKYKDDQAESSRRTMELYGRYGINPFAGCGPAVIQMPLFLTVYQCMLHYQFEFTKGYFLWINPAASKATNGILAPNLGQQDYLLIVIYAVTMVISTMLTPVSDPTQVKQQRMIGIAAAVIFPVMMLFRVVPVVSGFVLYWTFTNLFSMAQSLRAYRMPMEPLQEVNAPGGGVFPGKPQGRWAKMMEEMQKAAEEQQRMKNGGGPSKADDAGSRGNGKFSAQRPANDEPEGGTGTPAKHKPKKRK